MRLISIGLHRQQPTDYIQGDQILIINDQTSKHLRPFIHHSPLN